LLSDLQVPGILDRVEKTEKAEEAGKSAEKPGATKPKNVAQPASPAPASVEPDEPMPFARSPSLQPAEATLPRDDQRMAIDDVLQYALDHHPVLRQRQHEVEIAQAKLVTAGLLPNPQLTFDTDTPTRVAGETQLSGRLMFTVPTGGKRRYGMRAAQAGIQRAQMTVSVETEAVLVAAAETALEVLYLQELSETLGHLSELAAQGAEIQKARFELKAIPFTDKIIAETDAAEIETRRLDTAAKLESARMRLGRTIGINPPRPVAVAGQLAAIPIPDLPLENLLAAAQQTRPELAAARSAITESQWQLALARAKAVPDLQIGPRAQTEIGTWNDTAGARVQFDLPVFNRNQGGIAESSALVRARCAGLEAVELSTLNDVAAAHAELMPLRSRLDYYEKQIVPLAASTETMILEVYKSRAIEAVQVSDLQQKFARMRLSHLDLRYRYNQLLMRLELFLGRCLSDLPGTPSASEDQRGKGKRPEAVRLPDEADSPLDEPELLKTPPPPLPH
jgi:cobalt-zinc-cadmium efflux system outer membrane protein